MYPEIHFKPGKALVFNPLLHCDGKSLRIPCSGGIRIESYLITVSASKKLPSRHAICFAGKIPERHFHRTHTSALTSVISVLPDYFEKHLNIAGIQTKYPALQE